MVVEIGSHERRSRKVREWLLLLLRFAVTRDPSDRTAVLSFADEMDSLGLTWRPSAPRFFFRTSQDVCDAIPAAGDGADNPALRRHAARIEDPRLRRTFLAAVGLASTPNLQSHNVRSDLWRGLPGR
jgi:hypothetical protein